VRVEENEASAGGIIVPDTARQKPERARVVAVGAGRILGTGRRVPPSLRPGDLVLVSRWAGTEIPLDGTEYLILGEDEILGILG
jgi:chaperonin GroES